ncbi:hypothetical protein [Actinoplanes awajinensis]|uniref:hypothetical protein n=1 Tax=Actinoplanes awajinensis TaxID=135946 RepID=UPI000B2EDE14|nr:hypothetical protein [Actinoplanes awajinensis]
MSGYRRTMPLAGVVPFPEEFARRYRAAGYWQDRTLGEALDEACTWPCRRSR